MPVLWIYDLVMHLVFCRMLRRATTSAAMIPIHTLDTQTTGLTGKLGLWGCLGHQEWGFSSLCSVLRLEYHQKNNLSASQNYPVTFSFIVAIFFKFSNFFLI